MLKTNRAIKNVTSVKKVLLTTLSILFIQSQILAHAVQAAWCFSPNGDLRIYLEHWHGDYANPPFGSTIDLSVSVNGGDPVTTTLSADGIFNNTPIGSLPCDPSNPIIVLSTCGQANTYNDWAYWDTPVPPSFCPEGGSITVTVSNPNDCVFHDCGGIYPASATSTVTCPPPPCPDITCPATNMVNLQCISELPAGPTSVADFQALGGVVNGPCDPLTVTFSDVDNGAAGCSAAPRIVSRTITVTDPDSGQSEDCTIDYIFVDNTMPGITCPADITIECDEDTSPANTGSATGSDNCGGSPAITFADVVNPGPTAQDYSITRSWTATDACGNTNTCVQTITIEDSTPPVPVCLNPTVYLEPDGTYTLQDAEVLDFMSSTDNCSPVMVSNIGPAVVDCDDFDTTVPVLITTTDESGNTAQCTANVFVQKGNALPNQWAHNDVNTAIGDAGFDPCEEKYIVESHGYNHPISDEIHYAYQSLCGDAEIIARVVSASLHGFGGVMIRESFDPGSKKVALRTQLRPFVHRDIRAIPDTYQNTQQLFRPNHSWLKINRSGNRFVGYTSHNGLYWTFAFVSYVSMDECVEFGLYAEGPINSNISVVCFDNVSINGGVTPGLVEDTNDNRAESSRANAFNLQSTTNQTTAELSDIRSNTNQHVDFNLFPNPATNVVNVNLSQFEDEVFTLKVFNNLGQEVYRKEYLNLEEYIEKLDLSQYNNGIYMINIELQNGTVLNKKFVVNGK